MTNAEKDAALKKIAKGVMVAAAGNAKVRIGKSVVHVRYCSPNASAPEKFKFNINPNTLSADYELWVFGSAMLYYLMPISFLRGIYDNPDTYVDRRHPEIRVVSVDTHSHTVTYATGGVKSNLRSYLGATLP
jgi:hypothetical protein